MSVETVRQWPRLADCPVWCKAPHEHDAYEIDGVDLRLHYRTIWSEPTVNGRSVTVDMSVCDNLTDGTRSEVAVSVDGAEDLSPAQAMRLGRAIVDAVDVCWLVMISEDRS